MIDSHKLFDQLPYEQKHVYNVVFGTMCNNQKVLISCLVVRGL